MALRLFHTFRSFQNLAAPRLSPLQYFVVHPPCNYQNVHANICANLRLFSTDLGVPQVEFVNPDHVEKYLKLAPSSKRYRKRKGEEDELVAKATTHNMKGSVKKFNLLAQQV